MTLRIYLEMKAVPLTSGTAGHMYLVLRDDGAANLVGDPVHDQVIRGTAPGEVVGQLTTTLGLLAASKDQYAPAETQLSRHSVDITDAIGGVSKWSELQGYAADISGSFSYELPGGPHLANSNAVIFTILARAGLDIRDLDVNGVKNGGGTKYVDSFFSFGAPGGSSASATLLANSVDTSAANLTHDVTILGRDNVADTFRDSALNETIYGQQSTNGDSIVDTVNFSDFSSVDLTISKIDFGIKLSSQGTGTDKLIGIEQINLTHGADHLRVSTTLLDLPKTIIDVGTQPSEQRDVLDFSALTGVTIKQSGDAIFMSNGFLADTFSNGGVQFKNFEEVILTSGNDTVDIGTGVTRLYTGAGNDTVSVSGSGVTVNFGDGNDTLKSSGKGDIVKAGKGVDTIELSHNGQILIENANTSDHLTYYGNTLHGGVRWGGSESVYAYGIHGERYGRN